MRRKYGRAANDDERGGERVGTTKETRTERKQGVELAKACGIFPANSTPKTTATSHGATVTRNQKLELYCHKRSSGNRLPRFGVA